MAGLPTRSAPVLGFPSSVIAAATVTAPAGSGSVAAGAVNAGAVAETGQVVVSGGGASAAGGALSVVGTAAAGLAIGWTIGSQVVSPFGLDSTGSVTQALGFRPDPSSFEAGADAASVGDLQGWLSGDRTWMSVKWPDDTTATGNVSLLDPEPVYGQPGSSELSMVGIMSVTMAGYYLTPQAPLWGQRVSVGVNTMCRDPRTGEVVVDIGESAHFSLTHPASEAAPTPPPLEVQIPVYACKFTYGGLFDHLVVTVEVGTLGVTQARWYPVGHPLHFAAPLIEHFPRFWETRVTCPNGDVRAARSVTFEETDSSFPAFPAAPSCGGGLPSSITVWELSEYFPQAARIAWQWVNTANDLSVMARHPQCWAGGCQLSLVRAATGTSAQVECEQAPLVCADWRGHPADFECRYAGETLPDSECTALAPLYAWMAGLAVSDCATGELVNDMLPFADPVTGCVLRQGPGQTAEDALTDDLATRTRLGKTSDVFYFADPSPDPVQEAQERRQAARECLKRAPLTDCLDYPIFMPGSDVFEAAQQDTDAILGYGTSEGVPLGPRPVLLTYIPKAHDRGWIYRASAVECMPRMGLSCDEYPFASTEEGGQGQAAIRLVDPRDNSGEGALLSAFYRRCDVPTSLTKKFLTIPLEGPWPAPPNGFHSMAWCG